MRPRRLLEALRHVGEISVVDTTGVNLAGEIAKQLRPITAFGCHRHLDTFDHRDRLLDHDHPVDHLDRAASGGQGRSVRGSVEVSSRSSLMPNCQL